MKIFIGSLVGGIIIFMWQFLSWTALSLHQPAQQYTPKQDSILAYLSTQFDSSGGYMLPTTPPGASSADMQKLGESMKGKPWVQVVYHKNYDTSMVVSLVKAFITDFLMVLFFCWIISGFTLNSFSKTLMAALLTGLIVYLNGNYVVHIWYQTFDIKAYLIDYLVSWGVTGTWLGWWLNRKKA
jgi:hypothetical protein